MYRTRTAYDIGVHYLRTSKTHFLVPRPRTPRTMERWFRRVALVTGASSGIGKAVAKELVIKGMDVVACSRNTDKIEELGRQLQSERGSLTPYRCDVSKEEQVISMFEAIRSKFGGVDVCVNSAGLSHDAPLLSGDVEKWQEMFEINVIGMCICTKEAVKSMKDRSVDDGHIIQINSLSGHEQYQNNPSGHFYSATKFAVTSLVEGLKKELSNTHIRVTAVSPGLTETEFAYRMFADDPQKAIEKYSRIENLKPEDIAESVIYALSAPKHVRIHEIQIVPTEQ